MEQQKILVKLICILNTLNLKFNFQHTSLPYRSKNRNKLKYSANHINRINTIELLIHN